MPAKKNRTDSEAASTFDASPIAGTELHTSPSNLTGTQLPEDNEDSKRTWS